MYKNEEIEIRSMMNGYKVGYSYKERMPTATSNSDYEYVNDQYMFSTWDEVVAFLNSTKIETPPVKI